MKTNGYDGVIYKSGVSGGFNVALFDPAAAKCRSVGLVQVKSVQIDFVVHDGSSPSRSSEEELADLVRAVRNGV
jgi:hypothetical protein